MSVAGILKITLSVLYLHKNAQHSLWPIHVCLPQNHASITRLHYSFVHRTLVSKAMDHEVNADAVYHN